MSFKNLLIVLVLSLAASSCRKSDRDLDTDTTGSRDFVIAETIVFDVIKEAHKAIVKRVELNGSAVYDTVPATCPSIQINPYYPDTTTFPKIMVIDFGNGGCTNGDGLNIKGHITNVATGFYKNSGTKNTLSFGNLIVDDLVFKGSIVITTIDTLANGNVRFSVNVQDVTLTDSKDKIISLNYKRTFEWVEGKNTSNERDDVFSLTGNSSGYATSGVSLKSAVISPIKINTGCRYISEGVQRLQQGNLTERIIDYGTGCDASASVKFSGQEFSVSAE